MSWTQNYNPFDNLLLSATVASLPIVLLLALLAFFHMRAHWAAILGLLAALFTAVFVFGMPAKLALASAGYGAAFGLLPIGWIVVSAIFIYEISVETGQFEILRRTIAGLSEDKRIQALLIAFSFGAFIEGAAGFGTPVAISAAMMIGLGFKPMQAAGLALIGNTAPVAYGALGTPLITLEKVTGLPLDQLSQMVGRQLPVFSLIVPFWLIWAMVGFRKMLQVWPACLTAGFSFGLVQFLVSNYHGPWLVDVAGAAVSITAMVVLLKFWKPAIGFIESDATDTTSGILANPTAAEQSSKPTSAESAKALLPWIVLSICVFVWGLPSIKNQLAKTSMIFEVQGLHNNVVRDQPVVSQPKPEEAKFKLDWLAATGTALVLAGVITGKLIGLSFMNLLRIFLRTIRKTSLSLVTIMTMLALGFTTKYSGMDATMGLALASTGWLFPFFSPILGWLGVALTGSDTSSNVLFGNLQQITAQRVGISPILAAASNSSGGVMGKMIDAQSIVVASVATGEHGKEGQLLRYVFFHSIALAVLVGLLVLCQAYYLPSIIPS
ncbi:MAG: L-lactate permease [Pirellulales bacterium]